MAGGLREWGVVGENDILDLPRGGVGVLTIQGSVKGRGGESFEVTWKLKGGFCEGWPGVAGETGRVLRGTETLCGAGGGETTGWVV